MASTGGDTGGAPPRSARSRAFATSTRPASATASWRCSRPSSARGSGRRARSSAPRDPLLPPRLPGLPRAARPGGPDAGGVRAASRPPAAPRALEDRGSPERCCATASSPRWCAGSRGAGRSGSMDWKRLERRNGSSAAAAYRGARRVAGARRAGARARTWVSTLKPSGRDRRGLAGPGVFTRLLARWEIIETLWDDLDPPLVLEPGPGTPSRTRAFPARRRARLPAAAAPARAARPARRARGARRSPCGR